jgi:hypothetical protein
MVSYVSIAFSLPHFEIYVIQGILWSQGKTLDSCSEISGFDLHQECVQILPLLTSTKHNFQKVQ